MAAVHCNGTGANKRWACIRCLSSQVTKTGYYDHKHGDHDRDHHNAVTDEGSRLYLGVTCNEARTMGQCIKLTIAAIGDTQPELKKKLDAYVKTHKVDLKAVGQAQEEESSSKSEDSTESSAEQPHKKPAAETASGSRKRSSAAVAGGGSTDVMTSDLAHLKLQVRHLASKESLQEATARLQNLDTQVQATTATSADLMARIEQARARLVQIENYLPNCAHKDKLVLCIDGKFIFYGKLLEDLDTQVKLLKEPSLRGMIPAEEESTLQNKIESILFERLSADRIKLEGRFSALENLYKQQHETLSKLQADVVAFTARPNLSAAAPRLVSARERAKFTVRREDTEDVYTYNLLHSDDMFTFENAMIEGGIDLLTPFISLFRKFGFEVWRNAHYAIAPQNQYVDYVRTVMYNKKGSFTVALYHELNDLGLLGSYNGRLNFPMDNGANIYSLLSSCNSAIDPSMRKRAEGAYTRIKNWMENNIGWRVHLNNDYNFQMIWRNLDQRNPGEDFIDKMFHQVLFPSDRRNSDLAPQYMDRNLSFIFIIIFNYAFEVDIRIIRMRPHRSVEGATSGQVTFTHDSKYSGKGKRIIHLYCMEPIPMKRDDTHAGCFIPLTLRLRASASNN